MYNYPVTIGIDSPGGEARGNEYSSMMTQILSAGVYGTHLRSFRSVAPVVTILVPDNIPIWSDIQKLSEYGLTGIFLIAAVLTAFWTYDTYDGRWGRIPLPHYKEIESLHGTFGLYTLLIFPALVVYACHRGQRRLIQPDSLAKLAKVGKPIWWYTLSRITNKLSILAVTFALFSGKMMNETWLPNGELEHGWYYAHLLGWIIVVSCIGLHVLMNARVGGSALLMSILNWRFRDSPGERLRQRDHPALWYAHISKWRSGWRLKRRVNWLRFSFREASPTNSALIALEVFVLTSLVAAWIIPLFK